MNKGYHLVLMTGKILLELRYNIFKGIVYRVLFVRYYL